MFEGSKLHFQYQQALTNTQLYTWQNWAVLYYDHSKLTTLLARLNFSGTNKWYMHYVPAKFIWISKYKDIHANYLCARLSLQLVYMQAHVCIMLSLSVVTAFTIYCHYLDI